LGGGLTDPVMTVCDCAISRLALVNRYGVHGRCESEPRGGEAARVDDRADLETATRGRPRPRKGPREGSGKSGRETEAELGPKQILDRVVVRVQSQDELTSTF